MGTRSRPTAKTACLSTPQELVSRTQKELQRKAAINLHDGDDLDKMKIISYLYFRSLMLYQLYWCESYSE